MTSGFVFNDELWNRGFLYNCEYKESLGLVPKDTVSQVAIYISKALDSGEAETIWSRVKLDIVLPKDTMVSFSYFASDSDLLEYQNQSTTVDNYIQDEEQLLVDRLNVLESLWIEERKNPKDMLLSRAKGRYLWFKLELLSKQEAVPMVQGLEIEFPRESFVDYLPEFYRSNEENFYFLDRFLGMYQSMILDLQEEVVNISHYLDSDMTSTEFLHWLAEWVAIDDVFRWDEQKLRNFIKQSFSIYKLKGTKEGLERVIELYLGQKPRIVETYEIMDMYSKSEYQEQYQSLYGDNIYSFFVFVEEKFVRTKEVLTGLNAIIEHYKPAYTVGKVIVLKSFMVLGQQVYLGINSSTLKDSMLKLDGNTMLPFNTSLFKVGGTLDEK